MNSQNDSRSTDLEAHLRNVLQTLGNTIVELRIERANRRVLELKLAIAEDTIAGLKRKVEARQDWRVAKQDLTHGRKGRVR